MSFSACVEKYNFFNRNEPIRAQASKAQLYKRLIINSVRDDNSHNISGIRWYLTRKIQYDPLDIRYQIGYNK